MAEVLAAAMADFEERRARPLVMVVGMLGTKDSAGFLEPFAGMAQEVLAVPDAKPDGRPAGSGSRQDRPIVRNSGHGLREHRRRAGQRFGNVNGSAPRVLICGSLYLAGEVLAANGTPPA